MFVIKNINNQSGLQSIGEITVANLATGETTLDRVTVLTSINDITTSQFSKIQYLDISSNLSTMLNEIALEAGPGPAAVACAGDAAGGGRGGWGLTRGSALRGGR